MTGRGKQYTWLGLMLLATVSIGAPGVLAQEAGGVLPELPGEEGIEVVVAPSTKELIPWPSRTPFAPDRVTFALL